MKLKNKLLTVLIALLCLNTSFSQELATKINNLIGLSIGPSRDRINDQAYSPLNQKGGALSIALFYERRPTNIFKTSLSYTSGNLKSGFAKKINTPYFNVDFETSYLKKIAESESITKYYIGGAYNFNVVSLDSNDAYSFIAANELSISAAVSQQINKKSFIESSISIPVVAYVSRPPYNLTNEFIVENEDNILAIIFNGNLVSLKDYKAVKWSTFYNCIIDKNILWRFNYSLYTQSTTGVYKYNSISNVLSASIIINF